MFCCYLCLVWTHIIHGTLHESLSWQIYKNCRHPIIAQLRTFDWQPATCPASYETLSERKTWALSDNCWASTAQWRASCTIGKFQNSVTCHILSTGMFSCVSGVLSAPMLSPRIQWRAIFFQPVCVHVSVACYLHRWEVSEFSDVPYSFSLYLFTCQWRAICTTGKFQNSVTCHIISTAMFSCGSGVLSAPLVSFRIHWRAIFLQLACFHVSVACCLHH
jgi:hypothetical protein